MVEQQIEESPELCLVPRLSVFEDICPSEGVLSDTKATPTKPETVNTASNVDLLNGFVSPASEADRMNENRVKLENKGANSSGLKIENMDDFPSP